MSDIAIRVENLGKRYRIGERERYKALRDVITDAAASPLRKLRSAFSRNGHRGSSPTVREGAVYGPTGNGHARTADLRPPTSDLQPLISGSSDSQSAIRNSQSDTFWALKDVSFEVKRGEVVGIIGRNGAGKSTLLKILSRITAPTTGEVEIKGRVGSLLEVGTGFHPELTGRENIYLNGAILGMKRAEINRKFDEMVAFAEIEKFIDTPVKRYSSGMYVRLAFAVAAHLDPEILLVDEVLAVGDAQFQKKCLGKMGDVAKEGRTVLFVSHNMGAIQSLSHKGVLLAEGELATSGSVREVIARYLVSEAREQSNPFRVLSEALSLTRLEGYPKTVRQHEQITFHIELTANASEVITDLALLIHAPNGERVSLIDLRSPTGPYRLSAKSRLVVAAELIDVPFVENDFEIGLYVNSNSSCQSLMDLFIFSVVPSQLDQQVVPREPQYRGLVELKTRITNDVALSQLPDARASA